MPTALDAFRSARDFLLATRSDYDAAYAGFRWPQLTDFNWALDHFDTLAQEHPERAALVLLGDDGELQQRSFAELSRRSAQVANWLQAQGLARGDRVLLLLGNEVALWELMLGCIKMGAVMIPATTQLTRDDLVDRLERGRVRMVVTTSAHTERFDDLDPDAAAPLLRVAIDGPGRSRQPWRRFAESAQADAVYRPVQATLPDEPLLLYFTSGTTHQPKLVMHTHASYPVGHLSTMYWLGLQDGDVHWNISSPGWAKHAWSCLFAPWNAGATVFVFNYLRFDARRVLQTLVEHRVTTLCAPPTVWRMLIQHDLGAWPVKLREAMSAGEPLNPEVIEQVRAAWGLTIRDGFGQTETTAQIGNPPGQPLKFGSMGRPLPGYRVVLLDAEDRPAEEGEISLVLQDGAFGRPMGLMTGYVDSIERSAEVMRSGHYRTGDVAVRDAEGYITYVGRADDVFKASDYRISPFELESVLIEHPAVAEAAVVPSPDALKMALPKAFVALAAGHAANAETAASILAFCRERLAPYKRIRRLQFSELPKTISGKIRRVELRRAEAARALPAVPLADEYFD